LAVRENQNNREIMKKDVDITKRKKLLEEKLVSLLSKSNLKPSELSLVEEIEQKLRAINHRINR
jgi:hypothetical protein